MGFGHRVYRAEDPRARHMRAGVEALSREMGEPRWYQILEALVEAMKPYARHGVNVNVDFYAGVVYFLNGITEDLFVPMFAAGRVPGLDRAGDGAAREQHPDPAAHALRRSRAPRLRARSTRADAAFSALREDDRRGRDDVVDGRAAREVAHRPREALQHRSHRPRASEVLAQLVARCCRRPGPGTRARWPGRQPLRRPSVSSRRRRGSSAASACSSPSIASDGARRRAISSARTTLSTCACVALPLVENDRSATRGSSRSTRRQLSAEESAMSASCVGRRIGIDRAVREDQRRGRRTASGRSSTASGNPARDRPSASRPRSRAPSCSRRRRPSHRRRRLSPSGRRGTTASRRGGGRPSGSRPGRPSR